MPNGERKGEKMDYPISTVMLGTLCVIAVTVGVTNPDLLAGGGEVAFGLLLLGAAVWNHRSLARRPAVTAPGFMTASEAAMFENAMSLDQACHVMMSVHGRRLREFAVWTEAFNALRGPSWTLRRPDGAREVVEIREIEDFDRFVPRRRSWSWDLSIPKVIAVSGTLHREVWTFEPGLSSRANTGMGVPAR
jgi:hypothetical protein